MTNNPPRWQRYGRKKDSPDTRDYKFSAILKAQLELPPKVDLSDKMPPVVQQGYIGSCTACSTIGMIEYLLKKEYSSQSFSASILAQYYWSRKLEGTATWDSGAEVRTAMKALNKFGVAHDAYWPYRPAHFAIAPNTRAATDARQHKVVEYRRLNQNLNELKSCLALGFPFVFGFWVYESFESAEVEKTGIMPRPDTKKERFLGGHAVCICAYDDAKQAFLVRNSWGSSWGIKGHFWMPYDLVLDPSISEDFWTARMITMPPTPKPKPKPAPKPKPKRGAIGANKRNGPNGRLRV